MVRYRRRMTGVRRATVVRPFMNRSPGST